MPKLGTRVHAGEALVSGHMCDEIVPPEFMPFDALERFPAGALVDLEKLREAFNEAFPGPDQQLRPKKTPKTMTEASRESRARAKEAGKGRHDASTRTKALLRLSKLFPAEFEALLNDERARVDLGPIRRRTLAPKTVEPPKEPIAPTEATVIARIVEQTPGKCAHPNELRTVESFGTFCGHCGVRV